MTLIFKRRHGDAEAGARVINSSAVLADEPVTLTQSSAEPARTFCSVIE
jgi:hypothetical protein